MGKTGKRFGLVGWIGVGSHCWVYMEALVKVGRLTELDLRLTVKQRMKTRPCLPFLFVEIVPYCGADSLSFSFLLLLP